MAQLIYTWLISNLTKHGLTPKKTPEKIIDGEFKWSSHFATTIYSTKGISSIVKWLVKGRIFERWSGMLTGALQMTFSQDLTRFILINNFTLNFNNTFFNYKTKQNFGQFFSFTC